MRILLKLNLYENVNSTRIETQSVLLTLHSILVIEDNALHASNTISVGWPITAFQPSDILT